MVFKQILKRSGTIIITVLATVGTILMANTLMQFLPDFINPIFTFLFGLFLVLISGTISIFYMKKVK